MKTQRYSLFKLVLWYSMLDLAFSSWDVPVTPGMATSSEKITEESIRELCSDGKLLANFTPADAPFRSSFHGTDGNLPSIYVDGNRRTDLGSLQEDERNLTDSGVRDDRLIFTVVRFANNPCTGGGESGTCLTQKECTSIGGTVVGTCAMGFGSCCYKSITCGGSSSSNCTYLLSPNYPGTYNEARTCSMSITRGSDICQLRLDFTEFASSQPNDYGICNEDKFTVPEERKFTYLCGNSPANWHFYLDVNGKSNPTVFNFDTSSVSFDRKFKIKVTMIECSKKVPGGCGQYYTGASGSFASFNYGGPYLAGMDYAICFRKEKNLCTTTLTTLGYSFIRCMDIYRLPVGQTNGNTINPILNAGNMYCQFGVNVPGFESINQVPSPISSVTNGPLNIWLHTFEETTNENFYDNCRSCAGFYQMYSHNPC